MRIDVGKWLIQGIIGYLVLHFKHVNRHKKILVMLNEARDDPYTESMKVEITSDKIC